MEILDTGKLNIKDPYFNGFRYQQIDFLKKTIVINSNECADMWHHWDIEKYTVEQMCSLIEEELNKRMSRELIGRIDKIIHFPIVNLKMINDDDMKKILHESIKKIEERFDITIKIDGSLKDLKYDTSNGVRKWKNIILNKTRQEILNYIKNDKMNKKNKYILRFNDGEVVLEYVENCE